MKKILKKLGVIGLAVAVLSPFVSIPNVKAETTENCTKHLQNYLFLDMNYGIPTEYKNGYQTYTHFPFVFDTSSGIEYKNIRFGVNDFNNQNTKSALPTFFRLYNNFVISNKYIGDPIFNSGSTLVEGSNTYNTITTLWHGDWARFTESANLINPVYKQIPESEQRTFQNLLGTSSQNMKTTIYSAKFTGGSSNNGFDVSSNPFNASDLSEILSNVDEAERENRIWEDTRNKQVYIPFSINRKIENFDSFVNASDFYVGYTDGNGNGFVFSKSTDKVTNSYEAYVAYNNAEKNADGVPTSADIAKFAVQLGQIKDNSGTNVLTTNDIDVNTSKPYYWPAVLSVEYEACSSDPINADEWSIEYHENTTDSVKNMPKGGTYEIGKKITLGSAPTREGYKFQKWCEDKEGTGNCYNAGKKDFTSTTTGTIHLYAIWGDTSTVNNGDTGIVSYLIGFVTVGAIAGSIYLASKKKNLFKQI